MNDHVYVKRNFTLNFRS